MWLAVALFGSPLQAQGTVLVAGRVTLLDNSDHPGADVGQAVVWLTGESAPAAAPDTLEMATEGKQFVPRLLVVARGSTIAFPNHDPFNHNVFSLSPEGAFDLGLYGRGEAKTTHFERNGVIRVYCNVHATMRGLVMVQETGLIAQPGADGSFRLERVPPGDYVVHAWHERATETTHQLRVPASGVDSLTLTLDARRYHFVQHKDKEGKSYADRSRRY